MACGNAKKWCEPARANKKGIEAEAVSGMLGVGVALLEWLGDLVEEMCWQNDLLGKLVGLKKKKEKKGKGKGKEKEKEKNLEDKDSGDEAAEE